MDALVTPEPAVEHITGLSQPCELAGGLLHMCAVTADGAVYCWGTGRYGTLGSGRTEDQPTHAVQTLPPGSIVY
jgi:alpha-tubulin suppressor-like RCC1 family protein